MKLADGVLLCLDSGGTPFTRIWCDYELFKTVMDPNKELDIMAVSAKKPRLLTEKPLPGEIAVDKTTRETRFPLHLLVRGLQVKLEDGNATVPEDKENILRSMGKDITKDGKTKEFDPILQKRMIEYANSTLRGYFAASAWPQAVKEGLVSDFARNSMRDEDEQYPNISLPEVLKRDKGRDSLDLSFSSIMEVTDQAVAFIAEGLPPKLSTLILSFEGCNQITDKGVITLAECLGKLPLQTLRLDFVGCWLITDSSVMRLAASLPQTLSELRLDFALIPNLSSSSVKALAEHLPTSVAKLKATFTGTMCNETFDSVRQLRQAVKRLSSTGSTRTSTFVSGTGFASPFR
jgi:hypothetical protein